MVQTYTSTHNCLQCDAADDDFVTKYGDYEETMPENKGGGGVGVGFFTPPSAPGTEDTVYVFSNGKPYEFDKTKNVDKSNNPIGTSNPLSDTVKYLGG